MRVVRLAAKDNVSRGMRWPRSEAAESSNGGKVLKIVSGARDDWIRTAQRCDGSVDRLDEDTFVCNLVLVG